MQYKNQVTFYIAQKIEHKSEDTKKENFKSIEYYDIPAGKSTF
jgi:hypothetical protein